jgi:hypothetical protein
VGSPHHVVFTLVVSVFANLASPFFQHPLAALSSTPHPSFVHVDGTCSSYFILLTLFVACVVSIVCNGAKFGIQLKLAFESVEGGGH